MKNAAEDTFFKKKYFLNCNGVLLDFSTPKVMGILNLTPDSFYDGGQFGNVSDALRHVEKMILEGASIIDIGAQSTRPGSTFITDQEEWLRLEPVLKLFPNAFPSVVFSVDTFYSEVAEKAVAYGAGIVNDISGGSLDSEMFPTIAKLQVPYVLMHMQGTPQTMQANPHYENVVREINLFFFRKDFSSDIFGCE
jgi:dihydropteroate synthase